MRLTIFVPKLVLFVIIVEAYVIAFLLVIYGGTIQRSWIIVKSYFKDKGVKISSPSSAQYLLVLQVPSNSFDIGRYFTHSTNRTKLIHGYILIKSSKQLPSWHVNEFFKSGFYFIVCQECTVSWMSNSQQIPIPQNSLPWLKQPHKDVELKNGNVIITC